jgi:hypothetical protein
MKIVLTYDPRWEYTPEDQTWHTWIPELIRILNDPRWEYTPEDQTPFWKSLDTVEYVAGLLEETGNTVLLVKADDTLEFRLGEIMSKHSGPLVFWLNEFMPTDSGKKLTAGRPFTVSVIEKVGMMHTGPGSEALGIGLNKDSRFA